jgi:hypothetical protein
MGTKGGLPPAGSQADLGMSHWPSTTVRGEVTDAQPATLASRQGRVTVPAQSHVGSHLSWRMSHVRETPFWTWARVRF